MENVILLADKNSPSWSFAEKIQRYLQERYYVSVPLCNVEFEKFRNNEIGVHVPINIRKKDIYFIHDSSKNSQDWWVELLLLKDLLIRADAKEITFVLPNLFYSRQDRKHRARVPISAKALADSISTGVSRIITMDLHAPQIQGFYKIPLDNLYSFPDAARYFKSTNLNCEEIVVVSPDSGGVERARSFAQKIGSKHPIALIEKRRVEAGEVKEMRLVGDVEGKDVSLVDDIIDSGGTLIQAAHLLKEKGARSLMCYGTHGIFTNNASENLFKIFDRVITSDTIPCVRNEKIEIICVAKTFGESIYRAQKGLSISELFN